MKNYPGGTWIVLKGHAEKENEDLIAIGYKYNKKTVLMFVCTVGAGSTAAGDPYEARFPDKFGNVCVRHVLRPRVISNFFKHSNVVDVHNQARQFELALEKKWVTHEAYFRLYTTYVAFLVTNLWKTLKNNQGTIQDLADILSYKMIENSKSEDEDSSEICTEVSTIQVENDTISSLASKQIMLLIGLKF